MHMCIPSNYFFFWRSVAPTYVLFVYIQTDMSCLEKSSRKHTTFAMHNKIMTNFAQLLGNVQTCSGTFTKTFSDCDGPPGT